MEPCIVVSMEDTNRLRELHNDNKDYIIIHNNNNNRYEMCVCVHAKA